MFLKEPLIKSCVFLHRNFKYDNLNIEEMLKIFKRDKRKILINPEKQKKPPIFNNQPAIINNN